MKTWAVVRSGAKQYKVEEGSEVTVEKLGINKDDSVSFDEILLLVKDGKIELGKPLVDKIKVKGKVLENFKDKKVKVIKFKSKSRYLKTQGHRQSKAKVLIEKITS